MICIENILGGGAYNFDAWALRICLVNTELWASFGKAKTRKPLAMIAHQLHRLVKASSLISVERP